MLITKADELPECLFDCLDKDNGRVAIQRTQPKTCIVREVIQTWHRDIEIWEKVDTFNRLAGNRLLYTV